ncbi:MAG: ABC transporter permease [Geminicoccaceae bacterium]|nr:MAG: ABC transporter permease [Geminicoccaceae bacterium]
MRLPPYASPLERLWHYLFLLICGMVFFFLIMPILIIIPLSFNAQPFFTFTPGMLALEADAFSLRWYRDIFTNGMMAPSAEFGWAWLHDMWTNAAWIRSLRNSIFIGICSTLLATVLGTVAALGLARSEMPYRTLIMSLLISPMIVPLVITAASMFFFFSALNLTQTYLGIILAHTVLGTPFVIITVTATLVGFDKTLIRAGQSLGASPRVVFFKIILPLILPGVIAGALFAFITSFDEVVAVLFLAGPEQRTIPRQMWSGIREQISPTILAVATLLVLISIALLTTLELLRRRGERLRGLAP